MTATVEAYTVDTAAEATGLSADAIRRAIRAGDLRATRPTIAGKPMARDIIAPADLRAWLSGGAR